MKPEDDESSIRWEPMKEEDLLKNQPIDQDYGFPATPEYKGITLKQVDEKIEQLRSIVNQEKISVDGLVTIVGALNEIRTAYPSSKLGDIENSLRKIKQDYYGQEDEVRNLISQAFKTLAMLTRDRVLPATADTDQSEEEKFQAHAAD